MEPAFGPRAVALSAGAPAACRPPQSLLSCLSRCSRRRGRCAGAERQQQRMGLSDFQKTGPPRLNAVSICGAASRGRFVRTGPHIATPAGAAPLKRYCPRTLCSHPRAWPGSARPHVLFYVLCSMTALAAFPRVAPALTGSHPACCRRDRLAISQYDGRGRGKHTGATSLFYSLSGATLNRAACVGAGLS